MYSCAEPEFLRAGPLLHPPMIPSFINMTGLVYMVVIHYICSPMRSAPPPSHAGQSCWRLVAHVSNSFIHSLFCSLTKAKTSYSLMNEVHLSMLRGLASQASVIMGTVCAMAAILPSYYTSYANMLSVFLTFIEQAGRCVSLDSLQQRKFVRLCSRFLVWSAGHDRFVLLCLYVNFLQVYIDT